MMLASSERRSPSIARPSTASDVSGTKEAKSRVDQRLPAAIGANALGKGLICPAASGPEAAWAGADIDIVAPRSLIALANHSAARKSSRGRRPVSM
jgi:predicted ATPase with chaperone activity